MFTLEDRYGLKIEASEDGQPRIYLGLRNHPDSNQLYAMLLDWMDKAVALEAKQISQDEYDQWRYHYPTPGETTHTNFAKVIPQELSDYLLSEDCGENGSTRKFEHVELLKKHEFLVMR